MPSTSNLERTGEVKWYKFPEVMPETDEVAYYIVSYPFLGKLVSVPAKWDNFGKFFYGISLYTDSRVPMPNDSIVAWSYMPVLPKRK